MNVFLRQPKRDPKHYRRDIGKIAKGSIFSGEEEAGYRNADVELDKKQLLANIRKMQLRNQIVPSIAIREGVAKSFRMIEDHFMEHYGKKARWFVYNGYSILYRPIRLATA